MLYRQSILPERVRLKTTERIACDKESLDVEQRTQRWGQKTTGASPRFSWGRPGGWLAL